MSDSKAIPQIELAQGDSGCAVIVRHLQPLTDADIALWQGFEVACRVEVLMQSKGYDTLSPISKNRQQMSLLHYQIPEYGLTVGFYPHHFTQANALMNLIGANVMGYLGNQRGRVVGTCSGNWQLHAAVGSTGALAVGIEASDEAVEMARKMPGMVWSMPAPFTRKTSTVRAVPCTR